MKIILSIVLSLILLGSFSVVFAESHFVEWINVRGDPVTVDPKSVDQLIQRGYLLVGISYSSNVEIKDFKNDEYSLVLTLTPSQTNSTLLITIPRSTLDPKVDCCNDGDFITLFDGKEVGADEFKELTPNDKHRSLLLKIPRSVAMIDIMAPVPIA